MKRSRLSSFLCSAAITVGSTLLLSTPAHALVGSFFLTGHDPDFHASLGGNFLGSRAINNSAINFIMDPAFNPYVASNINKFLFVESNIPIPGGHTQGLNGIIASGYTLGTDFEWHTATTLNSELNLLGSKYSAIVIASDFGGILTQSELNILNSRSADIISFLNSGGGIYAMAESNNGAGLTPAGGHFGFLPFVVTGVPLNQSEVGISVTPFGNSIGLTDNDVNGNASHNVFASTFGLNIVDVDSQRNILSLAGRGRVIDGGVTGGTIPEPVTSALATLCILTLASTITSRSRHQSI